MDNMVRRYCKAHNIPSFSLFNSAFDSGIPTAEIMADAGICFTPNGRIYTGFRHYPAFDLDLEDSPCILLVRDPRDMLVSMYYSVLKSHVVPRGSHKFLKRRREAASMTIDEFVLKRADEYLLSFRKYQQKLPPQSLTTYRYEDIIYDKAEWLKNLVSKLGLPKDPELTRSIALEFDIFPETEHQERHIRQVHPGNYKTKLRTDTVNQLNEILGEFLNFYDYTDASWEPHKSELDTTHYRPGEPLKLPYKFINHLLPGCTRLEYQYPPRRLARKVKRPDNDYLTRYPRISIVVPSYNQGQFIEQTLKSIIDQAYPNLELIVVDGQSTDNTVEVIKRYAQHIKWWVSELDEGQASAINKGMSHATGEILAWLNSDDCLVPGALFRVADQFNLSEDTDVVYGHRVLINEAGEDVGKWVMPSHRKFILTYADFIPQETMFWRADLWQRIGGSLDESFRFAMDWELIRRFVDADAKFKLLPVFLGQFRMHEMQKTSANIETDGFKEMEIIRKQCQQKFSSHPVMQNLYYRMQRASFFSFVIRARFTELLWQAKLLKIT